MQQRLLSLLVFLFLGSLFCRGQITLTADNFPRIGDTLFSAVDRLPSGIPITGSGGNQRWDFTRLKSPYTLQTVVRDPSMGIGNRRFPTSELLIAIEDEVEAYFDLQPDRLLLLGLYGEDPLDLDLQLAMRFSPPLPERRAPLRYRDAYTDQSNAAIPFSAETLPRSVLEELPITPDSLRLRIAIKREAEIDAWGLLTIPGGIYDVLRERRVERRTLRLDAKIGSLDWQDITGLVSRMEPLGNQISVTHTYLSNSALEPIATVYLNNSETIVERVTYKANDFTTDIQEVGALKPGVYAFPNPAIVNVRFEFSGLPPGNYRLTIYNILGVERWSRQYRIDGRRTEKVDISKLSKGTYLYSLTDEEGKTIVTKRLMVVKP